MKALYRILPAVSLALASMGMDAQCPPDDTVDAQLGEPFDLTIGQSAVIEAQGLTLTFEDVPEDSRCPVEVTCPWMGDATVSMSAELRDGDLIVHTDFELHTNPEFDTFYDFFGYRISLENLAPYPVSPDEPIDPRSYVATLLVTQLPPVVHVELDTPFDLGVGGTAYVGPEDLRVLFSGVPEDSRCPVGIECAWEGDATVVLELALVRDDMGIVGTVELHTSPRVGVQAEFEGYEIELLDLQPYPVYGEPLDPDAYVAALVVSRL